MNFEILKGKTLKEIIKTEDEITFIADNGEAYKLYHKQECCESVYIEDVCGDLDDLIDSKILVAEEVCHEPDVTPEGCKEADDDSFLWTFYKLDTCRGGVTIRFLGESNGYYSESVDFIAINL